jgi:LuxR family maltose regulon positive regulatory protein
MVYAWHGLADWGTLLAEHAALDRFRVMSDARFRLKTVPPRLGRAVLTRPRLEQRWADLSERTAIVVTAPQGFGKTTLLAQWRRNWLAQGALVAWAALDAQDDRGSFVELLYFALQSATGRASFAGTTIQNEVESNRELDALTSLLADVALLATPVVVVLDDAHRMPQPVLRELLAYLLNNAPPNLQFLVGSRRPLELDLADLIAGGRLAAINVGDLRLSLPETLEVLRARLGNRIGLDDAVHLHDLTEGWPLGLQLAVLMIEPATDLHEMIGQLSARRGDLQRFFFESLLARLPPEEAAFLVRISILEAVTPDLSRAITGSPHASRYIQRLVAESPVVTEGEGIDTIRLHHLARDFLLGQFDRLPAEERSACYRRAATWYAEHGLLQEAAKHALAAGDEDLAVAHASRCLLDIAREGRLAEAQEWISRLPASVMARDVRLQLTAAWITALGSGAAAVPALLEGIARHPQFDDECRLRSGLIAAGSAIFCDKPGLIADAVRAWKQAPSLVSPLDEIVLANSHATLALHLGENERVRRLLEAPVARAPRDAGLRLTIGFADLLVGLSHVFEGNADRAVAFLQPRLLSAKRELGRRSTLAAMLAGPLARAHMLRGDADAALATLAGRLDVIERGGLPDPAVLAYRTLAAIAIGRGDDARAVEILAAMYEFGARRELPRVLFVSLADQIRLHAARGRVDTATGLLAQLDALGAVFEQPAYRPFRWYYERMRAVATAYARFAASDLDGAAGALDAWTEAGLMAQRGALALTARAMLALIDHARGRPGARERLAEVLSLADLGGIRSYVESAHPQLAPLIASVGSAGRAPAPRTGAVAVRARDTAGAGAAPTVSGGLLTSKEAQILSLLAVGKANKEIARSMDIGEQTVKWHLKNVFFKLNAASRKHAVVRARLLGLLEG